MNKNKKQIGVIADSEYKFWDYFKKLNIETRFGQGKSENEKAIFYYIGSWGTIQILDGFFIIKPINLTDEDMEYRLKNARERTFRGQSIRQAVIKINV